MKWNKLGAIASLFGAALCAGSASAASIAWMSFHADANTPTANAAAAGYTVAPDKPYTDLLTSAGHTVTRFQTANDFDVTPLNAFDVVIIGRSVDSANYEADIETAAFNGLSVPTIVMGGYTLRNNRMGYTTGTSMPDTAGDIHLKVNNPAHPLFTGIAFDGTGTTVNPYAGIVTFTDVDPDRVQRGISVNANTVVAGGQVLATVADAADPAFGGMIVGYFPPGTSMSTSPVNVLGGKRLVFLSGSRETDGINSQTAGMYDLTDTGAHLFLNAVTWIQNVPEPSSVGLAAFAMAGLGLVRRRAR